MHRFGILTAICISIMLISPSFAFANRMKSVDLNKTQNLCPSMNIGNPATEVATFLGVITEGTYLAELRFADGKTELIPIGNAYDSVLKLEKDVAVSIAYQDKQFWDEEGDGSCRLLTEILSIESLAEQAKITDAEYKTLLGNPKFKYAEQTLGDTYKACLSTAKNEAEKKDLVQDQRRWVAMREKESAKRFQKNSPAYVQYLIDWATERADTLQRLAAGNPESVKADGYFYTLDYDAIPFDGVIKPEHRLGGNNGQPIVAERQGQQAPNESEATGTSRAAASRKDVNAETPVPAGQVQRDQSRTPEEKSIAKATRVGIVRTKSINGVPSMVLDTQFDGSLLIGSMSELSHHQSLNSCLQYDKDKRTLISGATILVSNDGSERLNLSMPFNCEFLEKSFFTSGVSANGTPIVPEESAFTGIKKSRPDPLAALRKAAEQGNAEAQRDLGIMYANGKDVAQDYTLALQWLSRAAEQDDYAAQYNLGIMYEKGMGVSQDDAKAVEWYRKAAYGLSEPIGRLRLMWKNGSTAAKITGFSCDAFTVKIDGKSSRAFGRSYSVAIYGPGGALIGDVLLDGQEISITSRSQWPGQSYTSLANLKKSPNEITIIQVGGDMCRYSESFR